MPRKFDKSEWHWLRHGDTACPHVNKRPETLTVDSPTPTSIAEIPVVMEPDHPGSDGITLNPGTYKVIGFKRRDSGAFGDAEYDYEVWDSPEEDMNWWIPGWAVDRVTWRCDDCGESWADSSGDDDELFMMQQDADMERIKRKNEEYFQSDPDKPGRSTFPEDWNA